MTSQTTAAAHAGTSGRSCSMCSAHVTLLRSLAENLRGKAEILRKQNDGYMQHSCLDLARIIDEHIDRTSNAPADGRGTPRTVQPVVGGEDLA